MDLLIGVLVVAGVLFAAGWYVMSDYIKSEDKTRFRNRMTAEQKRDERRRWAAASNKWDKEHPGHE